MSKSNDDWHSKIYAVAEKAVQRYARGLLTAEVVSIRIMNEWEQVREGEEQPSQGLLIRIAQRICSRELCNAWRSADSNIRELAFLNLKEYLAVSLRYTVYVKALQSYVHAVDDVIYQTLEELHAILMRHGKIGPDDPAAFLKWVQVIMNRKAYAVLERLKRNVHLSLEEEMEHAPEQFVDASERGPLENVLHDELRQILATTIATMRNKRYQQVLIHTYLLDLDDAEIASRMGATVQDIYLWRSRALARLRKRPEIVKLLRSLQ